MQLMSCPSVTEVQEFRASLGGLHVIVFSNTPNADFFQQEATVKFICGVMYVGGSRAISSRKAS